MALSSQQRGWMLGVALLATLASVFAVQQAEEPAAEVVDDKPASIASSNSTSSNSQSTLSGTTAMATPDKGAPGSVTPGSAAPGYRPAVTQAGVLPEISDSRKQGMQVDQSKAHPDLLGTHAWYVPPPPAPVVSVQQDKPVAPQAPFQYMGKLEDSPQGTLIFLSVRNKLQTVTAGQQIDASWRLDKEDAGALYLTYIPLGSVQVLSKAAKRAVAANPSDTAQAETSQGETN